MLLDVRARSVRSTGEYAGPGFTRVELVSEVGAEYLVRIFLLGDFVILRPDGTPIPDHEWRTAKNRDLLRLLALHSGAPVSVAGIVDKLWGDTRGDRARASLGTAISHLRRTLGPSCVMRRGDTITLERAWVDVTSFEKTALAVQKACSRSDFTTAVALAQSGDYLHVGEFRASDDDTGWGEAVRASLAALEGEFALNVAEAALALHECGVALDHARAAVELNPADEPAHRALMRAYAGLGEIGAAVRAFETYRDYVADETHAAPTAQTLDLYLELLRTSGQ
ncbi:hypothetical protein GCM10027026_03140 [Myroides odoratimimus subsp. xuanwuensis]